MWDQNLTKKTHLFLRFAGFVPPCIFEYTTKEKGLQYLLAESDKVVKEFEEDKNNELISGPHIFYYQGKGSDDGGEGGNANWEVYPYSSTRNMSQ